MVFRLVAHIDATVLVYLVGVCGKLGIHGEGVALGEFEADARVKVAPRAGLGSHVVGHGGTNLVDETYLLERVVACSHLHLQVVANVH